MRMLMPIGVLLIVIGAGGTFAACFGSAIFDGSESGPRLYLAPLAGLTLAIGLVCVGIGIGNWRRPVPSDVRPANPWSDQPAEHGDPPRGIV